MTNLITVVAFGSLERTLMRLVIWIPTAIALIRSRLPRSLWSLRYANLLLTLHFDLADVFCGLLHTSGRTTGAVHLLRIGRCSLHTQRNLNCTREGKVSLGKKFLLSSFAFKSAYKTVT